MLPVKVLKELSKILVFLLVAALLYIPVHAFFPVKPYTISKSGHVYIVDLGQQITAAQPDYIELQQLILGLSKDDTVMVKLHGYGGEVTDASLIRDALHHTEATTVAYVDGPSYSAHAYIACAAQRIHLESDAMLMFHAPYSQQPGDGRAGLVAFAGQMLQECVDKGILTKQNVTDIMLGKEVYVFLSTDVNGKTILQNITNDGPHSSIFRGLFK